MASMMKNFKKGKHNDNDWIITLFIPYIAYLIQIGLNQYDNVNYLCSFSSINST